MLRLSPPLRSDAAVSLTYATPDLSRPKQAMIRSIEFASGVGRLKRAYVGSRAALAAGEDFHDLAIRLLDLTITGSLEALARVPRDGPVLVVANHPYGVLDGLVLGWLIRRIRSDAKILAHSALYQLPEARDFVLPIDFAGTPEAEAIMLASRKAALDWLRQGHVIGIFPAGAVATTTRPLTGPALDLPWAPFAGKLALTARPTIVPVYFEGQNSRLFQLASHISQALRQSLLFHETIRRRGTKVRLHVGEPIPPADWQHLTTREALVSEMRRRTFALAPADGERLITPGRLRIAEKRPAR